MHNLSRGNEGVGYSCKSAAMEAIGSNQYLPTPAFMEQHYSWNSVTGKHDVVHLGTGHTARWPDDVRGLIEGHSVF